MTQEILTKKFDFYLEKFEELNKETNSSIEKQEFSKGPYFEVFPFSNKRLGFKEGKLIDIKNLKSKKDFYKYSFNSKGQLIKIEESTSLDDEFYTEFIFREGNIIKNIVYDYDQELMNVTYGIYSENGLLENLYSKGSDGGIHEIYNYDKFDKLQKIEIRQFDEYGKEVDTLYHNFEYGTDGELLKIYKANEKEVIDLIYSKK